MDEKVQHGQFLKRIIDECPEINECKSFTVVTGKDECGLQLRNFLTCDLIIPVSLQVVEETTRWEGAGERPTKHAKFLKRVKDECDFSATKFSYLKITNELDFVTQKVFDLQIPEKGYG